MSQHPWIVETQKLLQPLISRPVLKDKLLERPPFRALHDIVTSVIRETGFLTDLFPPNQLISDNVTAKEDKIAFMDRLRTCIELAMGHPIDCNSLDVVAGKECHKTNFLLQCLAKCVMNRQNLNMAALVVAVDTGVQPGTQSFAAAPAAVAAARPVSAARSATPVSAPPASAPPTPAPTALPAATAPSTPAHPSAIPTPAAHSTPTTQPNAARSASGHLYFGIFRSSGKTAQIPNVPIPNEDWVNTTISFLSPLVTKPPIAAKYIEKPPFRYLMDVVFALETHTGIPKGLFLPEEKDAEYYKPGAAGNKQTWLSKLITYTACGSGDQSLLQLVEPKNIAAGREPQHTSLLLQRLAILATSGVDSEDILAVMQGQSLSYPTPTVQGPYVHHTWSPTSASASAPAPATVSAPAAMPSASTSGIPTPATPSTGVSQIPKQKIPETPVSQPLYAATTDYTANLTPGPAPVPVPGSGMGTSAQPGVITLVSTDPQPSTQSAPLGRVSTARRAPPKPVVTAAVEIDDNASTATPLAVIKDAGDQVEEEDGDDLSKKNTVDGMGTGMGMGSMFGTGSENAGQLVSHIQAAMSKQGPGNDGLRLGRVATAKKTNPSLTGKQAADLELAVQRLCGNMHSVGNALECVGDDLVDMAKELEMWVNAYQTAHTKLEAERQTTQQTVSALLDMVGVAENECEELETKLAQVKAQMLANENEINRLLEDQVNLV